jgi:hypothetical protein
MHGPRPFAPSLKLNAGFPAWAYQCGTAFQRPKTASLSRQAEAYKETDFADVTRLACLDVARTDGASEDYGTGES